MLLEDGLEGVRKSLAELAASGQRGAVGGTKSDEIGPILGKKDNNTLYCQGKKRGETALRGPLSTRYRQREGGTLSALERTL